MTRIFLNKTDGNLTFYFYVKVMKTQCKQLPAAAENVVDEQVRMNENSEVVGTGELTANYLFHIMFSHLNCSFNAEWS